MDIRLYLRGLKGAMLNRSIALKYPWNAKSRFDQIKPISEGLIELCEVQAEPIHQFMRKIPEYLPAFRTFTTTKGTSPESVYWQNNYLPGLDIVALYTMMRTLNPGMVLEIGSGHSTAVMNRAITDGHLQTKLVCMDPAPRREIKQLTDEWLHYPLEELSDYTRIDIMSPGDIIFFDGSHISLANSDVSVFFMEILPRIPIGVYVHIHDVYLPYDYPLDMAHRGYNEQYLLAMALLYGQHKFQIIFPSFWVSRQATSQSYLKSTVWDQLKIDGIETHGGSFWFKILS